MDTRLRHSWLYFELARSAIAESRVKPPPIVGYLAILEGVPCPLFTDRVVAMVHGSGTSEYGFQHVGIQG